MKHVLLLFILFSSFTSKAQNLVPNPGFESGSSLCDFIYYGAMVPTYITGWEAGNEASPDIFSTTSYISCYSRMPYTTYYSISSPHPGEQMPHSGSRFGGFFAYSDYTRNPAYREYLQVKLSQPLIAGKCYYAEMYVNTAEYMDYAISNLGMYFSASAITGVGGYPFYYTPQVYDSNVIKDTANWVKISGTFQASTNLQYLTIGNFFHENEIQVVHKNTNDFHYAYYFVDDVKVIEVSSVGNSLSYLNPDICEGDTTHVKLLDTGVENITWTVLGDPFTIVSYGNELIDTPADTTYYVLNGIACGFNVKDTIRVNVHPKPVVNLGNDTALCMPIYLSLSAPPGYSQYIWQDQSGANTYYVLQSGIYSVMVYDQFNCRNADTIRVDVLDVPYVELGHRDTINCADPFKLSIRAEYATSYVWSTGETSPMISPAASGTYWVRGENACGVASDTITCKRYSDIVIPNLLTLNNDQLNEHLVISGINNYGTMSVFNRWGEEIFYSPEYNNNWPVLPVSSGVYYYLYTNPNCPDLKGWIHVIGE